MFWILFVTSTDGLFSLFWREQELTKFINQCNEVKAATIANKEGGQLSIVKAPPETSKAAKK